MVADGDISLLDLWLGRIPCREPFSLLSQKGKLRSMTIKHNQFKENWFGLNMSAELELPWVEKYRPKSLNDVVGNDEIVSRLRVIGQTGNMPHMLLAVRSIRQIFLGTTRLWQNHQHYVSRARTPRRAV